MTNEEFLDLVPWYQGIAAGAVSKGGDPHMAAQSFWLGPKYFAMARLARRHPEEFAQLVAEFEKEACERYGAKSWAEQEPRKEEAKE
jgi:hypothetical protein